MWKTEAQKGQGLSTVKQVSAGQLGSEPRLPSSESRVPSLHLMLLEVRQGPSWHREGLLVGRAEVCAVPLKATGGGLAAAATGAGVSQNVVVTPVLELALGLAPGSAFCVQELAALPLLLPQPADKHSRDPS